MTKKKNLDPDWRQEFYNGLSCGHAECGDLKKPCNHCGRINFRGNVLIQNRVGFIHFERLNSVNKKIYLKATPTEQETIIIRLWIGPGDIADL